jgi:hypothetical protein
MDDVSSNTQTAGRFLEQDHQSLDGLFALFQSSLDEGRVVPAFELLDLIWARLAIHIRAEHLCLFPALLNAPARRFSPRDGAPEFKEVQDALALLRSDHDFFMHELASAVNFLRSLKDSKDVSSSELDDVRDRVNAVYARLDEHNRIEEERAYKWIALVLTEAERVSLLASVESEFEKQPPRFEGRNMHPTD